MPNNKPYIIYVGPVEVPSNSAASRRVLGNAKAIQAAGYKVMIGGAQVGENNYKSHEGIEVYEVGERKHENLPTLLKYAAYSKMGKLTIEWLDTLEVDITAIVLYSGYSPYLLRLLPWCKKKNIPLVFDAVEWYEASSTLQKYLNPYYWNIDYAMRRLIPQTQNVIAISTYLQDYYVGKNCNTVIIPPLLDTRTEPKKKGLLEDGIILSYTGSPGKKDYLDNCLDAVIEFNEEVTQKNFIIHIAGIDEAQLLTFDSLKIRGFKKLPVYIKSFGMVPTDKALSITRNSHFSMLLRPDKRVSNAGFPTKVVESLAMGTPLLLNLTSDLGDYINDAHEGFVCEDGTSVSLLKVLNKVANLNQSDYIQMSRNAYKQAQKSFDISSRTQELKEFIQNLKK